MQEYENASLGVVTGGAFHYEHAGGRILAVPGTILAGNASEQFSFSFPGAEPVSRSVVAIRPSVIAELAADFDVDASSFGAIALAPSYGTLSIYGAVRRLALRPSVDDEALISLGTAVMKLQSKAPGTAASPADLRRVADVAEYIDCAYSDPITLDDMAAKANLSRFHFIRVFGRLTGERPRKYLLAARLRAASDRLLQSREPIISIALNCGFNDISNFTNTFRRTFGMSPRQWRAVN